MKRILLILFFFYVAVIDVWARSVWVSGESAAITLYYEGIYVSGTYVINEQGKRYDPSSGGNIQQGDVIISVNGEKVKNIDDFYSIIETENTQDFEVSIQLIRNNLMRQGKLQIFPKEERIPLCGLYMKDKVTGIGTITYFDEDHKVFGALGHSLQTSDGGNSNMNHGILYEIPVLSIRKSSKGNIGEKVADTSSFTYLGNALINNVYGIYGKYTEKTRDAIMMETASQSQVRLGKASLLTVIEGNTVEEFEIEIDKLNSQNQQGIKGIHFIIKDDRLIHRTGGIVQGMSGSPILQNGKLIGAVTHVIITSPLEGYGVYIDFMLKEGDQLSKS